MLQIVVVSWPALLDQNAIGLDNANAGLVMVEANATDASPRCFMHFLLANVSFVVLSFVLHSSIHSLIHSLFHSLIHSFIH